ncbi:MAG: UDP-N-acetylmuramate--L-alanine ligase [Chromatiales bacterium]|nr:MAG: UDP-N-acetylmuramate--L-alanine ligase [Chromatiales bacterium]
MNARMRKINCIHFVGIGGVGMGGIAEVLVNLGYRVQGSDLRESAMTRRLARLGATVQIGHRADNVAGADVIVVSTAIDPENPEVVAARDARKPIVQRAEMLGELMRFRRAIAVSGTHGKTTTTSLVASVLAEAGEDPTFVIGGRLKSADTNSRLGTGPWLVAEADESDASFLHLQPVIAVVTNIDVDHMDTYGGDVEKLRETFLQFLHNLPFYGLAVLCLDDPGVAAVLPAVQRATLTYGTAAAADVRASDIVADGIQSRFNAWLPGRDQPLAITLNLPGRHNVLNALAACAIAHELDLSDAALATALNSFAGIERRLQVLDEVATRAGKVLFVDDYGHHPTEIIATMAAAREAWPERRLVVVFQPHRYTRTRDLLDDFAAALCTADQLFVCEVYPAGEAPIAGADGRAICRAIRSRARVEPVLVTDLDSLPERLNDVLQAGDLVLTLGAGDIGAVAATLPAKLAIARQVVP